MKPKFKRFTGSQIRQIRKVLKQSQTQFADNFICSSDYISSLETGRRTEHSGMFSVIMQQLESVANEKRATFDRCRGKLGR